MAASTRFTFNAAAASADFLSAAVFAAAAAALSAANLQKTKHQTLMNNDTSVNLLLGCRFVTFKRRITGVFGNLKVVNSVVV
jgi:hypothetical protein